MPRINPTTKADVIGNLDINPERGIGDYLASVKQTECQTKHPNWDSAGDGMELMFIRNQREHDAMLRLQKEMLENSKQQAAINVSRTKRLYKTQAHLRKRFIAVNGFIKECSDKRHAAIKEVGEEVQKHENLKAAIEKCKYTMHELNLFRFALRETVEELEPYERVIEDVVKASDIFTSVQDCMDRCDALMLAQVEIFDMEQRKLHEIEDMRKRMVTITNEAALTVLGLKNDLAELERGYNLARSDCLRWEKVLANAKDCVAHNNLNKERSLDGIHHIYLMLCKRRNVIAMHKRYEVERQLDFIKSEVEVLRAILREHKKLDPEQAKRHNYVDQTNC